MKFMQLKNKPWTINHMPRRIVALFTSALLVGGSLCIGSVLAENNDAEHSISGAFLADMEGNPYPDETRFSASVPVNVRYEIETDGKSEVRLTLPQELSAVSASVEEISGGAEASVQISDGGHTASVKIALPEDEQPEKLPDVPPEAPELSSSEEQSSSSEAESSSSDAQSSSSEAEASSSDVQSSTSEESQDTESGTEPESSAPVTEPDISEESPANSEAVSDTSGQEAADLNGAVVHVASAYVLSDGESAVESASGELTDIPDPVTAVITLVCEWNTDQLKAGANQIDFGNGFVQRAVFEAARLTEIIAVDEQGAPVGFDAEHPVEIGADLLLRCDYEIPAGALPEQGFSVALPEQLSMADFDAVPAGDFASVHGSAQSVRFSLNSGADVSVSRTDSFAFHASYTPTAETGSETVLFTLDSGETMPLTLYYALPQPIQTVLGTKPTLPEGDFWKYVTKTTLQKLDGDPITENEQLYASDAVYLTCEFSIPAADVNGQLRSTSTPLNFSDSLPLKAGSRSVMLAGGENYTGSVAPIPNSDNFVVNIEGSSEIAPDSNLMGSFTVLCNWKGTPASVTLPGKPLNEQLTLRFSDTTAPTNYITKVLLVDENEKEIKFFDLKNADYTAKIWLKFSFALPDNTPKGTEFEVNLPEQLKLETENLSIPIYDASGLIFQIDGDKTGKKLTFTYEKIEPSSGAMGNFVTPLIFTSKTNSGSETLVFSNNQPAGTPFVMPITYTPYSSDPKFEKVVTGANGNYTVKVRVLPGVGYVGSPIKYTDNLSNLVPADKDFKGTFGVDESGSGTPDPAQYDFSGSTLTYTFPQFSKLDPNKWYAFTYKVKVDPSLFSGEAASEIIPISDSSGAGLPSGKRIDGTEFKCSDKNFTNSKWTGGKFTPALIKLSYEFDASSHKLNWTAVVNGPGITMKDPVFYVGYVADTGNDDTGYQESFEGEAGSSWSSGPPYNLGLGTDGTLTESETITFSTHVKDAFFLTNHDSYKFQIKVRLTWNDESGNEHSAGGGNWEDILEQETKNRIVQKAPAEYDPKTGILTWNIIVNENKAQLPDLTLTDDLGTLRPASTDPVTMNGSAVPNYTYADNKLTIPLGNSADKTTLNLQIKTLIPEDKAYSNLTEIDVSNSLSATDGGSGSWSTGPVSTKGSKFQNNLLQKEAVRAYDPVNRTIDWKVTINADKAEMTDLTFTDTITSGEKGAQKFVADSLKINGTSVPAGTLTDTNQSFTYSLDSQADSKEVVLTYRTIITDTDGFLTNVEKNTVSNKAEITFKGKGLNPVTRTIGQTAKQEVPLSVIDKRVSNLTSGTYLTYEVTINKDFVTLADGTTVTDVLKFTDSKGSDLGKQPMAIDLTSLELVSYTSGAESSAAESLEGRLTVNGPCEYSLTLPAGAKKYVLTYRANVIDRTVKSYTANNTATLKIGNVAQSQQSAASALVELSSASFDTNDPLCNGKIIVSNKDSQTGYTEVGIPGTVYELTNSLGQVIATKTTSSDGTVTFDGLNSNNAYTVTEVKQGPGYKPSTEAQKSQKVTLSPSVKSQNANFISDIIKVNFSFTKTFETPVLSPSQPIATFKLTPNDPLRGTHETTVDISANGTVTFNDIRFGSYKIEETTAPTGYEKSPAITVTMEVDTNDSSKGTVKPSATELVNKLIRAAGIEVKLTGELKNGDTDYSGLLSVDGSTFELWKDGAKLSGPTEIKNGTLTFPHGDSFDFKYGETYTIKQTGTVAYYEKEADDKTVTINGTTATVSFVNKFQGGVVTLNLTDGKNAALNGAKFRLTDSAGNDFVTLEQTTKNGEVQFLIPNGVKGFLKETAPVAGYEVTNPTANPAQIAVELPVDGSNFPVYPYVNVPIVRNLPTFTKVGDGGRGPLSGAVFKLYQGGAEKASAISGKDGVVAFQNVSYGNYIIEETTAPAGYNRSDVKLDVAMTQDTAYPFGTVPVLKAGGRDISDNSYQFENQIIKGKVTVTLTGIKYDADTQNNPKLDGSTFELAPVSADPTISPRAGTTKYDTTSGKNVLVLENVPYAEYVVKQTGTINGYREVTGPQTVILKAGADEKSVSFVNRLGVGKLTVQLTDMNNHSLSGGFFVLKDRNGKIVKSDSSGSASFTWDEVPFGDYTLEETAVPEGYAFPKEPSWPVSVTPENWKPSVTAKNGPVSVSVGLKKLVAGSAKNPVEGAEFALMRGNTKLKTAVSGADGSVLFTGIGIGSYQIVETKAAPGFVLPENPNVAVFEATAAMTTLDKFYDASPSEVINRRVTGTVTFKTKTPLKGVKYAYYSADDPENPIGVPMETDENGLLTFSDVPWGEGFLIQLSAPSGYGGINSRTNFSVDYPQLNSPEPPLINDQLEIPRVDTGSSSGAGGGSSSEAEKPSQFPKQPGEPLTAAQQKLKESLTEKIPQETAVDQPIGGKVDVPSGGKVQMDTQAANGKVTLKPDGTWEYTPNAGFEGTDSFILRLDLPNGKVQFKEIDVKVLGAYTTSLPQTGRFINTASLLGLGTLLILAGATYEIKRKRR